MTSLYVVMKDDQPWKGIGNPWNKNHHVRAFPTKKSAIVSLGLGKSLTKKNPTDGPTHIVEVNLSEAYVIE